MRHVFWHTLLPLCQDCHLMKCHLEVAQEKWSCGEPRPCLAYGLIILVLLVIWSGHSPSSLDDIIWGSTWNYPDKDPFLYIGILTYAYVRKMVLTWVVPCGTLDDVIKG